MSHLPPRQARDFILAATDYGPMIVNRNDRRQVARGVYGVGHQLLSSGAFDSDEVRFLLSLLSYQHRINGAGVVAIDGGANIGVHTLSFARHMIGWGSVLAFEAQEILFYALAGNVVLNNCMNARVRHAALAESNDVIDVPRPDYGREGSFGSIELRPREHREFIGQALSYDPARMDSVDCIAIDSLELKRLDLLKLDVEGMEAEVLAGSRLTLERLRSPVFFERIKSDANAMMQFFTKLDYRCFDLGINCLALHKDDALMSRIRHECDRIILDLS